MKKILVTGAGGFIGRNLIESLRSSKDVSILAFHHSMGIAVLQEYCRTCDFVFHFAGVNRPSEEEEFVTGNVKFTYMLIEALASAGNACPIVFASSVQAQRDNAYGKSKHEAECILRQHGESIGSSVMIYRLPNVFGKWCKPDYNSAIATFCYNTAHGLSISVHDPSREMTLVYIDDFIKECMRALVGRGTKNGEFYEVPVCYHRSLGEIARIIQEFPSCRNNLSIPKQEDMLTKRLYSSYLSYLPSDQFSYELNEHKDARGLFAEFVRTEGQGQFSVNVAKPGIVKGNHWHASKHEKFLVVSGRGCIRFRLVDGNEITEYDVSGDKLQVVEIPPGYTHSIENVGDEDLVTVMWANENFDPDNPDTYFLEV